MAQDYGFIDDEEVAMDCESAIDGVSLLEFLLAKDVKLCVLL